MSRRSRFMAALAVATAVFAHGEPASAASLRRQVALHGDMVRLSDLFSDLQPGQDCDIGPAPAPGQHIVVPFSQLVAIASQFGVDWQPGASYASAVLNRPARLVRREEIMAILKPAMIASGMPPGSDVSLGAFASPSLPAEATAPPEIQTLDYDVQSGRFSALLAFPAPDADPVTLRVTGRAEQQVNVLALNQPLPAGSLLSASNLQVVRVRSSSLHGTPITAAADVDGLALKQQGSGGVPLTRDMLIKPMLVSRGRPVVLRLEGSGLTLTTAGVALEAGAAGDRIHVINSVSHAVLIGQVTSTADVRIDAGTAPVILQSGGTQSELPQLASGASTGGGRNWNRLAQEASYP